MRAQEVRWSKCPSPIPEIIPLRWLSYAFLRYGDENCGTVSTVYFNFMILWKYMWWECQFCLYFFDLCIPNREINSLISTNTLHPIEISHINFQNQIFKNLLISSIVYKRRIFRESLLVLCFIVTRTPEGFLKMTTWRNNWFGHRQNRLLLPWIYFPQKYFCRAGVGFTLYNNLQGSWFNGHFSRTSTFAVLLYMLNLYKSTRIE